MARLPLFDSHAHMDSEYFDADRSQVFKEIEENLAGMINPGCDRKTSLKAMEFATSYPFVYAAVGWHPEEISRMVDEDLELLKKWCSDDKVVAIGEVGLDYYNDENAPHSLQRQRFIQQIHIARETGLPLIVHDREAHGDILKILQQEARDLVGVFHCYSGSVEMAKELLKMGWYFPKMATPSGNVETVVISILEKKHQIYAQFVLTLRHILKSGQKIINKKYRSKKTCGKSAGFLI